MIRKILLFVFALVFIFSTGMLLKEIMQIQKDKSEFEELRNQIDTESLGDLSKEQIEKEKLLAQFNQMYQMNNDYVGWIEIPNTIINYPVMQTSSDEEYYLHRNFKKEYSPSGTPFLSATSRLEDTNNQLVVYGHNMNSGLMFHDLMLYKDQSFWETSPTILWRTKDALETYEIFSAFEINVDMEKDHFAFYVQPTFHNNEEFNLFLEESKNASLYDTGITPQYGETIMSLVTCDVGGDTHRMVLMAVKRNK